MGLELVDQGLNTLRAQAGHHPDLAHVGRPVDLGQDVPVLGLEGQRLEVGVGLELRYLALCRGVPHS